MPPLPPLFDRRTAIAIRIAAVVIVLWLFLVCLTAVVEAHDRGDFLPCYPGCDRPTSMLDAVMSRGYGIYDFDTATGAWPKARQTVYDCFEDLYQKTKFGSQPGILWFERGSPWVPDPNAQVDLVFTLAASGNVGWAGQAMYANYPAVVDINLTYVASYSNLDSTYCHENGHLWLIEDQYKHPLTCDIQATWTVMSCGTYIGELQPYDVGVVLNVFTPDQPSHLSAVRLDSNKVQIKYNGLRQSAVNCVKFSGSALHRAGAGEKDNFCGHYSPNIDNATRVAVFGWLPTESRWELVAYGPTPAGSNTATVDVLGLAPDVWGRVWVAIHPESAIEATWLGGIPYLSGDLKLISIP